MDEVVGVLAEAIVKKLRAARRSGAVAAAPASRSPGQAGQVAAPRVPVPQSPAVLLPAAPPADPFAGRRLHREMPPEPPAVQPPPPSALPAAAVSSAAPAPSALLAAFRGGTPLLASIVLAEALGPPLSLQPFDARKR